MPGLSWSESTREEVGGAARASGAVAVLPVGATEQHGPHLPTGTDAAVATEIARRACARATTPTVLLPTMPFGASDHHLPFGGTLSIGQATLGAVLDDLLRSVATAGFTRVLILNGHGGNHEVCGAAVKRAAVTLDILAAAVSYWHLLPPAPDLPGHAGAFETSVMSALAGDLVRRDVMAPPPGSAAPGIPGVTIEDQRMWATIGGYTDDPATGSASRGDDALEAAATALADVIDALAERPR